ncbi:MAG TPA: hypothetical protein VGD10_10555 [Allosphingosinicella sp.]|uniref:hypothetical protein n=1 Tax=Allosphingosinicella sp. TaxID=2823234 RepID=UPI002EDA20B8
MRIIFAALAATALTACSVEQASDEGSNGNAATPASEASAPAPSAPVNSQQPPAAGKSADASGGEAAALGALSRADIESELESGAGCSLRADRDELLVAVQGDAIARPANKLIHLAFKGNELYEGGTFSREDFSIEVRPLESHGTKTGDEEMTRDAAVTIREPGKVREMQARWSCGA